MIIRIATRKSALALWQANHVYELIKKVDNSLKVFLIPTQTEVDKDLSIPISQFGGRGAFSKGVQALLLNGKADIAVHSAKDLEVESPPNLTIAAYPPRGLVQDVLVGSKLSDLPTNARVATGSSRRKALLLEQRPDLKIEPLRGNIETRLKKLEEVDAIVAAAAALKRLDITPDVVEDLDPDVFIPQVGQGALAIEAREDDFQLLELLQMVDDVKTRLEVEAERSFLRELGGNCELPAGSHAVVEGENIRIRGFLADEEGIIERAEAVALPSQIPGKYLADGLVDLHRQRRSE